MKKIFFGLLFLLLDLTLYVGDASFSLIPSFVGYLLLFAGLNEALPFAKLKETRASYLFFAILELGWFGWWSYNEFFAPSHDDRTPILAALKLLLIVIAFFAVKKLLVALSEYEAQSEKPLHTARLMKTLKLATLFAAIGNALALIALFDLIDELALPLQLLSSLGIAAGHALSVVFLTLFYLAWKESEKQIVTNDHE